MVKEIGHASFHRRVAFNVGGGFTPGVNALVIGAGLAANKWGWDLVGIRDGFAGLLFPERYPDGGLVSLDPQLFENLDPAASGIIGQSSRVDPFHVRHVNEDNMVEELDLSDAILERFEEEEISLLTSIGRNVRPRSPAPLPASMKSEKLRSLSPRTSIGRSPSESRPSTSA